MFYKKMTFLFNLTQDYSIKKFLKLNTEQNYQRLGSHFSMTRTVILLLNNPIKFLKY